MDAPESRSDLPPRTFLLLSILLLAVSGILLFSRLGDRHIVSEELRWAQIAKEMRSSGDFLLPTINGKVYFDKPVGSYWLIVAASYLVGSVDVVAARLPSAVAGWLAIVVLLDFTRRLYDRRTAILAGAILAGCFDFVKYGRHASADMETLVGVLLAVRLFALIPSQSRPWRVIALWVLMAAVSQTKGLLGFALPMFVLGVFGILQGLSESKEFSPKSLLATVIRGNRWFFNWWTLLALPLGVGLFLAPFIAASMRSGSEAGLELLYRENIKRFFTPHNHTGPVWLYMKEIFVLAAPWSIFLPSAIVLSLFHRRTESTNSDRFASSYFWAIFAFFTLAASRRNYYLLPILPAASILLARVWSSPPLPGVATCLRSSGVVIFMILTATAGLALVPPSVLSPPYDVLPPLPSIEGYAAGWGISLFLLSAILILRPHLTSAVIAVVTLAAMAYIYLIFMPATEEYRSRPFFAAEVMLRIEGDSDKLALFHARDIVFDLGLSSPVTDYSDVEQLRKDIGEGRVRWVIARKKYWKGDLPPASIVIEERTYPWEGESQREDKMMLIEVK